MAIRLSATDQSITFEYSTYLDHTPCVDGRAVSVYHYSTVAPPDGYAQYLLELNDVESIKSQFLIVNNGGNHVITNIWYDVDYVAQGYFGVVTTPILNQWVHYAFNSYSSGNCQLWINGATQALVYANWTNVELLTPNDESRIGGDAMNLYGAHSLAHFSFWSTTLTQQDVDSLRRNPRYAAGRAAIYVPMDDMATTSCRAIGYTTVNCGIENATAVDAWVQSPSFMTDNLFQQSPKPRVRR